MRLRLLPLALLLLTTTCFASDCVRDWGKCGGKGYDGPTVCCNTRFFCKYTDPWYSGCTPKPIDPLPPAPKSDWCGDIGTNLNLSLLANPSGVNTREIAEIWVAATEGSTIGHAPGGMATCVEAVSTALGECGHPAISDWMTIESPACDFKMSGFGGVWQVTSTDKDDIAMASCHRSEDVCCSARLAYAHAYLQGGATVIPEWYCDREHNCLAYVNEVTGENWNDPEQDKKKSGMEIPDCSMTVNPFYDDGGKSLTSLTIDQEPCWWGPFSIAAGGHGKSFFPGFYGWGGFFQHYIDSKAGMCDPSPQGHYCDVNSERFKKYPTYGELSKQACQAALKKREQNKPAKLLKPLGEDPVAL